MSKKLPKNKVAPSPGKVATTSKKSSTTTNINNKIKNAEPKQSSTISSSVTTAPVLVEKKMSEEELRLINSAIKIQCSWRKYKAVQLLKKLREEKKELNEKLAKLEQEAFIQMIKMEQQREEKKRMKQLKEKQLKKKRDARRKKFLEAAYDGNLQEMKFLITDLEKELDELAKDSDNNKEPIDQAKRKQAILNLINSKDMNNNSALSEAAAGGSVETCLFLLKNNADPNSRGAFGRTPLWRSAFAGHLDCVQCLLENGGDPRLYSQDGQRVKDAATKDSVIDLLSNWNIDLTDRMLKQIEKTRLEIKKEQINSLESRKKLAFKEYSNINTQYELVKNELYKCNVELQRLHDEYLLNPQMYAPLIDQKESDKTKLQLKYDDLREKTFKARINYKDLLMEIKKEKHKIKKSKTGVREDGNESDDENPRNKNDEKESGENEDEDEEDSDNDEKMLRINIKEFDDMILRDLNNLVKNSKDKWPLIIDQNDQASTFLRYRDTNYVNCLDMQSMQPEKLRLAIIGSIRYGKPFVVDLMQYDKELFETFKLACSQIDLNLFVELCNKSLLEKDGFLRLVKIEKDGKEYELQNFNTIRMKNFKCIFLTSNPYPNDDLIRTTLPIKIITSSQISAEDLDLY